MTARATTIPAVTSDGSTWDQLSREHWPKLVGYARRKGCSDPEAVAGDALADAFEGIGRFQGDSDDFGRWLYTIAHRRITDTQRRWYRSPEILTDRPAATSATDIPGPHDALEDHEVAREALAAVAELPDRDRTILTRRLIEERPVAAVAGELGLSNGAVRVYQTRALGRIRAALTDTRTRLLVPIFAVRRLLSPIVDAARAVAVRMPAPAVSVAAEATLVTAKAAVATLVTVGATASIPAADTPPPGLVSTTDPISAVVSVDVPHSDSTTDLLGGMAPEAGVSIGGEVVADGVDVADGVNVADGVDVAEDAVAGTTDVADDAVSTVGDLTGGLTSSP